MISDNYEEADCQQEAITAWNSRVILDGCENELIVRCKDCKHYNTIGCSKGFGWCENIDRGTSDNFYCANGKQGYKWVRKDEYDGNTRQWA